MVNKMNITKNGELPQISIEALELGYFALNPALDPSKEELFKIKILNSIKKNEGISLKDIKHTYHKKIISPIINFDQTLQKLIKNDYLSYNDDKLILNTKGIEFLNNIENDVSFFLKQSESLFIEHGIPFEQKQTAYDVLDYLASKDSHLISILLGIKQDTYLVETEFEGLSYITKDKVLIKNIEDLINKSILTNEVFRKLFLLLLYGHIAEYLLLSSSDKNLLDIFKILKTERNQLWIILDTNMIVALLCHYDPINRQINALFDFLNNRKNTPIKINFLFHDRTIRELSFFLNGLEDIANQILYMSFDEIKNNFKDEEFRSPLRSFYYEKKYRDWNNYCFLFWNAWEVYKKKYSIKNVSNDSEINIDKINQMVNNYSKLLFFDDTIQKRKKSLEHDVTLFILANKLADKYEKDSIMKKVLILTKDATFESLEQSMYCLDYNYSKKSMNLRQIVAYLSPILSSKEYELDINDKLLYGSSINQSEFYKQQKIIQNICISLVNTEKKYSLKRLPGDVNTEILKQNIKFSKELLFNISKRNDEVII